MPVQLVAARIRLPVPFAIGTLRPAWFVNFPQGISFVLFSVMFDSAAVGVGPIDRRNGSGNVSFRRHMLATLGHFLKETQSFKSFSSSLFSFGIFGSGISKTFSGAVH